MKIRHTLLLITALCCSACVTEEQFADTAEGNFEALWHIIDEHYCFFDYKAEAYGLDWNEVHDRYAPQVSDAMPDEARFEVMGRMLSELRDGHVNLYAGHDVARYARWYDDYPANYADTLIRKYLGRNEDYRVSGTLSYRVLGDNIGYIRCPSFENEVGDGNIHYVTDYLSTCDGLIIDVRHNGGGKLTAATALCAMFVNETQTLGYMCHKTGKGHSDFSQPEPMTVHPAGGLRWQKPIVVLTNRHTYSAANTFVMMMHALDGVTLIGDRTGGGSGMPFSSELPCGYALRFSACPMYDINMQHTEFGIEPDIKVDITSADYQRSTDTIIEAAVAYLKAQAAGGKTPPGR